MFHGNFKNVSRVIQRSVMEMSSVSQKLQSEVSWVLQGNFKGVVRVFHMGFKKVSKATLSRFKGEFQ